MVNRGWVYAPDGATIDFDRWHDRDSVFSGYVDDLPATGGVRFTSNPRVVTRLSADLLRSLPYPVLPIVVVVLGDSEPAADRPARLGVPPLDEGPHLSYAIQWFAFALIALVGAGVVVTRSGGPQDA
jgi:surfeit locus 1 family protein